MSSNNEKQLGYTPFGDIAAEAVETESLYGLDAAASYIRRVIPGTQERDAEGFVRIARKYHSDGADSDYHNKCVAHNRKVSRRYDKDE